MQCELGEFLERNNLSKESLERSHLTWDDLVKIGLDHDRRIPELRETAEFFVRTIQRCSRVHSVRWRVKDSEHLMEKLIRKTDPDSDFYSEKYNNVNLENYHELVTDLVGVRAIHLFKDEFLEIDKFLCEYWTKNEKTTVYKRDGDLDDDFAQLMGETEIKEHKEGYRSIHYIFESKPMNRDIYVEVQVRTIFEEGWSEIDHSIRYPNFSDNELVGYFLKVFNRLAGSADEMGSFVKSLVSELEQSSDEVSRLQIAQEENIQKIDSLLSKLQEANGQNANSNETIDELKGEIEKLKEQTKPIELNLSDNNLNQIRIIGNSKNKLDNKLASSAELARKTRKIAASASRTRR